MNRVSRIDDRTNGRQSEHGAALLELALLLPMLVLIAVCGLLMSSTFGGLQLTRSFSRELGIRAYRECTVGNTVRPLTIQNPDVCLARITQQFQRSADKVAGSSEFVVSIYTINVTTDANGNVRRTAERTGYYASGTAGSTYSLSDFDLETLNSTESLSLNAFRKLVVAEAYVSADNAPGSLYFLHSIVPFSPSEMLYAATVL